MLWAITGLASQVLIIIFQIIFYRSELPFTNKCVRRGLISFSQAADSLKYWNWGYNEEAIFMTFSVIIGATVMLPSFWENTLSSVNLWTYNTEVSPIYPIEFRGLCATGISEMTGFVLIAVICHCLRQWCLFVTSHLLVSGPIGERGCPREEQQRNSPGPSVLWLQCGKSDPGLLGR